MNQYRFLKVISDTGFGFSFVSFLFYSTIGTLGTCVTFTSLLLITMVKLWADTSTVKWIRYLRTPLRISGSGLLFIALCIATQAIIGTAQASSTGVTVQNLTITDIAPFLSALFFGTANMMLASQLAETEGRLLPVSRNPETYLFLGYISIGLLSGIMAVYAMPFVLLAFGVTLYNYTYKKPAHNLHPVLIYALAEICFSVIALNDGKMILFAADILCAAYLVRVDMLVSSGGIKAYAAPVLKRQTQN